MKSLRDLQHAQRHAANQAPSEEAGFLPLSEVLRRTAAYVSLDPLGFIRYDNDEELIAYYRELARRRIASFFEAEALPPDSTIGGRTFTAWQNAVIDASGRVLQHIAFATMLKSHSRKLSLRNLLTTFARKNDIENVLRVHGEPEPFIGPLMTAMTLDSENVEDTIADHEVPLPFYIDLGRDFVLLPCFGALLNPTTAIVRFLKTTYRKDWDRALDSREDIFREELRALFPEPRFAVPPKAIPLKRENGTSITDIDAVLLDRETGSLALMQFKWQDIYGRSLKERNSRRLNLLKANEWVDRVENWIDGRSADAVATALKLGHADRNRRPEMLVVTRYAAQFTRNEPYSQSAAWLGWADLVRTATATPGDVIGSLAQSFRGGRQAVGAEYEWKDRTYHLPGIRVDLRVR